MRNNQSGASITEYALVMVAILVIVIGAVRLVGMGSKTLFSSVNSAMVGQ